MDTKQVRHWLLQVSGKQNRNIFILAAVQALLGFSTVVSAQTLRRLVDEAVKGAHDHFIHAAFLFAGIIVFQIALRAVNRFLDEFIKSDLENRFKKQLFDSLLNGDYAAVTAVHSGEWMNRLTSDTVIVAEGMTSILPGSIGMIVRLTGSVVMIIYLIPKAALLILSGGTFMIMMTYVFRKGLKRLHRAIQEADGSLRVYLQEHLAHMLIVRAFVKEQETSQEAEQRMVLHRKARMRRNHFSNFCNIGFGTAIHGAYALGAVYCGYGILNGTMTYGTFTAILQLVTQIQSPVANLSGYLPRYYAMIASAERLMEAEEQIQTETEQALPLQEINLLYQRLQSIDLKDISFSYPAKENKKQPLFSHLDLSVARGSFTAVTGVSGCGKSTLLKLIMCLYSLDDGGRLLRLLDGTTIPLTHAYQRLFAYVPQGNQLMSGTIREAVSFGRPETDEAVWDALELAGADDFIKDLPDGLDSVLGEGGLGLSEGQLQRLAIARALCSGCPVLLLDEATSALDEETEYRLLQNLRRMTDRTVMIVTHRPAVLAFCDHQIHLTNEGVTLS